MKSIHDPANWPLYGIAIDPECPAHQVRAFQLSHDGIMNGLVPSCVRLAEPVVVGGIVGWVNGLEVNYDDCIVHSAQGFTVFSTDVFERTYTKVEEGQ